MKLTNEERETHLNLVAADREWWEVFTDDPVMVRKLDKIADGQAMGQGKTYRLHRSQVSLRQRRIVSDSEREKMRQGAEHLRRYQRSQNPDKTGVSDTQNG